MSDQHTNTEIGQTDSSYLWLPYAVVKTKIQLSGLCGVWLCYVIVIKEILREIVDE
jgi:hypothetical protein